MHDNHACLLYCCTLSVGLAPSLVWSLEMNVMYHDHMVDRCRSLHWYCVLNFISYVNTPEMLSVWWVNMYYYILNRKFSYEVCGMNLSGGKCLLWDSWYVKNFNGVLVGLVADLQKSNFRNCIYVVSYLWQLNTKFSNQPQCKLIISPLKYSDYKLLCHLGDADAEWENAEYVCKSMVFTVSWVCHLRQFVLHFTLQGIIIICPNCCNPITCNSFMDS